MKKSLTDKQRRFISDKLMLPLGKVIRDTYGCVSLYIFLNSILVSGSYNQVDAVRLNKITHIWKYNIRLREHIEIYDIMSKNIGYRSVLDTEKSVH